MKRQREQSNRQFILLAIALLWALGLSGAAFAVIEDGVNVDVDVLPFYEIQFPDDGHITMNEGTGVLSSWIGSGNVEKVSGGEFLTILCNTPVRVQTSTNITLLHEGAGPATISVDATVGFFGGGSAVGSGGGLTWVDLSPGLYEAPGGAVFLTVEAEQEWTHDNIAGIYTGTVILNIGPQ